MVREAGPYLGYAAANIVPRSAAVGARPAGTGPFGYLQRRELSPRAFFMVLLSPRTRPR
jgi:hypothetical protein